MKRVLQGGVHGRPGWIFYFKTGSGHWVGAQILDFLYPFVTACCGMEYMSVASGHYDLDRFGAGIAALLAAPGRRPVRGRNHQP